MVSRLTVLTALFTLGYSYLVFHLYQLQVERGEFYTARAESLHGAFLDYGRRGSIYFTDREGNRVPAASNKEFPTVYAVPKSIENPAEAARNIGPLLAIPVAELETRLSKKDDLYELLAKKVDPDIGAQIDALGVRGVYVRTVAERFYPFGTLASHLLGYVGPSDADFGAAGHYGVEEFYDEDLRGRSGAGEVESVTLTIDPNIQLEAERILKTLVTTKAAKSGSVVVEDPKTGKILTMASYPSFDPNAYSKSEIGAFLNPATQELYEPGSVFKVITMAAGIDAGKITPSTTYEDTGELYLNGKTIRNWDLKAHGRASMTYVIEHSLNTGAAYAEMRTGNETFTNYVKKFGFGEKTGVDLLGEAKGDIRALKAKGQQIDFASASFGQGVAVSTIELANAFSALANGGVLMRPYVNAARGPEEIRRVVSSETARQVTDMMVSAVDGALIAKIKGYAVAGKTGTAQVADLSRGGYYEDRVVNTYAGFAPASDPRFVIVVKLAEPEGAPLAGSTVVPAFRDLAQFILNYYMIPPDRLMRSTQQ